MQSGSGGPGRVGPTARAGSTSSAAASPSSSSSGFDSVQQQQQSRQAFRKAEGNESLLSYQAGAFQGVVGGRSNSAAPPGSTQTAQQSRKFFDLSQLHGSSQEGQNRNQGVEQQAQNPVHQAYLQYAFQAAQQKQALAMQSQQQQAKMGVLGPTSGKDQEMHLGNLKMQELTSMQAASQAQPSTFKNSSVLFSHGEKPVEQGNQIPSEQKPQMQPPGFGQPMPTNVLRPVQDPDAEKSIHNITSNPVAMQAMQACALMHNLDLSNPSNFNSMAQVISQMQRTWMTQQKLNDNNAGPESSSVAVAKQQVTSPPGANESSPRINSPIDLSGQTGSAKVKHTVPPSPFGTTTSAGIINNNNNTAGQQLAFHGRENQMPSRQAVGFGNGMPSMHPPLPASNMEHGPDQTLSPKNVSSVTENMQIHHLRQLTYSSSQSAGPSNDGNTGNRLSTQGGSIVESAQQHVGFTKQQLHVLKAQILAFRRLKKGEGTLPQELLRAISPPSLEMQLQQQGPPARGSNEDRSGWKAFDEPGKPIKSNMDSQVMPNTNGKSGEENEAFAGELKVPAMPVAPAVTREATYTVPVEKEEQRNNILTVKEDQEAEQSLQKIPVRSDFVADKGKAVVPQLLASDAMQAKKPASVSTAPQSKDATSVRKYHGPLFDFPFFTRRHDSSGLGGMTNTNNNLTLAYDVKDLLSEEGIEVLSKKRSESLKKINGLLAVNLERRRIRPDLVLRLQIEQKKLRLLDLQARLKDEMDQQQQEIMAMPERPYRKFVRLCERQRMEMMRQLQASQKAMREKQWKSIFQWRKKLLEAHWAIRDARTARNRGVAKYHERMLREFSKRKDDDRNRRMEALKNNDVDRYREMLLEQQTSIPGDAAERYAVLSSFLSQTEEYLHKLGSKITAAKNQQEVEEAANAAAAAARQQGLSEEEVRAAAACAGEEVMIRNQFMEMNAPKDSSSVNKYYTLAHAVNEKVVRQPSMLRAGTLRDYQLVGLQWMLSLYNNKLNGILADEMGLGKTVQVMALIAYLMEFKGNYGPHLIIVPNAVLVNWKSEFLNWLPSVSCIFYVGNKEQRSRLFSQEVCAMKYNVLVTTYEFIMYDRSKLSKVDWKYIIIDEAQRMKDRESVLARDLDRYRCQRRLLLTGTPLQNDLKELWSLLNLLLPEVFDNRKAFHDWFSKPFQKEGPTDTEDDWLETEKKVIIIHRLHQILEPFMLRRRVEDVEGSLPPKVSVVLRCRMSAFQSAIYDWVKSTGTLRVDPEDELVKAQRNPVYQARVYRTLNNRCMELRKTCNHPLLNYPYFNAVAKEFLVRSCGKLWILDRILIKLQHTGHRVLLFSTMTKLLDILEEYLQWRRLVYRRIDGTTSLEDRESAIVDFNSPDSDCFIFLLSIRAAGRGLNLQSADTVIIYDPDPNPKNEEQAVARAHRIGQTREVKVIYMEAVVDKISSHQKEDELRNGGTVDLEEELVGKDRYMGSIEGLIRNNIQQYKIDMADEVINAGRFDQRTTHEERRMTLETLLHDEERYQETVHDVPSLQEVNRMIARSEEEVELFDQMDEELDWTEEMTRFDQVPKWLRASSKEVNAVIANLSKKPSKNILFASSMGGSSSQMETEKKRGRPKGKKPPNYKEIDDDDGGFSEASSEERNGYSEHEEEGEIRDCEDDESSGAVGALPVKDQSEDEGPPVGNLGYEYPLVSESTRENRIQEEAGSLGSSSDSRRMTRMMSPVSSQKFGSLSALDAKPGSLSKRTSDELEEGEIAIFGDSHTDYQQSESGIHERDDGEGEQVLQPKIKRKRSIRLRPRYTGERPDDKSGNEMLRGDCRPPLQAAEHKYQTNLKNERTVGELKALKQDQSDSSKNRRSLPSRRMANTSKLHASPKSTRLNLQSSPKGENTEYPREKSWDGDGTVVSGNSMFGSKMSDLTHRKCKNVISKFQRRVDKEGQQIVPLLTDLWKRGGNLSSTGSGNNILDLWKIEQRVDRFVYNGVMDLVLDVQLMLKKAMQFYDFSREVTSEARKVHDLFFDILKIAFPDTDFQEARDALSFTVPGSAAATRLASVNQSKKKRSTNEVGTDSGYTHKQRGPIPSSEGTRIRVHVPHKETKLGSGSGGSSREQYQQDDSPLHPGDLVVCKKKRKDRDKSVVKLRPGSSGPVSPPSIGRNIVSPGSGLGSNPKDVRQTPQNTYQQGWANRSESANGSTGVGWANPVKRLRTDSGKRRPSHL